jgi:hypothetical protein
MAIDIDNSEIPEDEQGEETHSNNRISVPAEVELKTMLDSGTIDISAEFDQTEYYYEYDIDLRYLAEEGSNLKVLVTLENQNDLTAEILKDSSLVTDDIITLPSDTTVSVSVKVSAEEHQPAGIYTTTFRVMDEGGTQELNSTTLRTEVEQYYDIEISKIAKMTYSHIVDPNQMSSDIQTEEFEVVIENHGNDIDIIGLEMIENRNSPNAMPGMWEEYIELYEKNGSTDTIDEIEVAPYDKISGMPGTKNVILKINLPKEEEEGRFWLDLMATSSAPYEFINNNMREDFETETNTTLMIQMVLPDLSFDNDNCMILKDDGTKYLDQIDTIFEGDTIEVMVVISNKGTASAKDIPIIFSVTLDSVLLSEYTERITVNSDENVQVSWDFTTTDNGMYYFMVKIDPDNNLLGDSQHDNTWGQYLSVQKARDGPFPYNRVPSITITTEPYSEFKLGDDIVIEGTWTDPDDDDAISMKVKIKLPDGTDTGTFIPFDDLDGVGYRIDSDGSWEIALETSGMIDENVTGEFTFTFVAEDDYDAESNDETIRIYLLHEDDIRFNRNGNGEEEKKESMPLSVGLFSFDILVILIIIIIIITILIMMALMSSPKPRPGSTPSWAPPPPRNHNRSPVVTYCICGSEIPEGSDVCYNCRRPAPGGEQHYVRSAPPPPPPPPPY